MRDPKYFLSNELNLFLHLIESSQNKYIIFLKCGLQLRKTVSKQERYRHFLSKSANLFIDIETLQFFPDHFLK